MSISNLLLAGVITKVSLSVYILNLNAGMVTDAAWFDINNDKKPDLVVVGDWMPVSVFVNTNGKLENKTANYFAKNYNGWWNKLLLADLNGDGMPDYIKSGSTDGNPYGISFSIIICEHNYW